jgi:hypothetical protein
MRVETQVRGRPLHHRHRPASRRIGLRAFRHCERRVPWQIVLASARAKGLAGFVIWPNSRNCWIVIGRRKAGEVRLGTRGSPFSQRPGGSAGWPPSRHCGWALVRSLPSSGSEAGAYRLTVHRNRLCPRAWKSRVALAGLNLDWGNDVGDATGFDGARRTFATGRPSAGCVLGWPRPVRRTACKHGRIDPAPIDGVDRRGERMLDDETISASRFLSCLRVCHNGHVRLGV